MTPFSESLDRKLQKHSLSIQSNLSRINPRADLTLENLSELIGQVQYLIDYPYDSNAPQK